MEGNFSNLTLKKTQPYNLAYLAVNVPMRYGSPLTSL